MGERGLEGGREREGGGQGEELVRSNSKPHRNTSKLILRMHQILEYLLVSITGANRVIHPLSMC